MSERCHVAALSRNEGLLCETFKIVQKGGELHMNFPMLALFSRWVEEHLEKRDLIFLALEEQSQWYRYEGIHGGEHLFAPVIPPLKGRRVHALVTAAMAVEALDLVESGDYYEISIDA